MIFTIPTYMVAVENLEVAGLGPEIRRMISLIPAEKSKKNVDPQIYDQRCCPDDLKFIEALDEADDVNAVKWAGARGRRRTISITV
jgi:hypothetical protein